MDTSKKIINGYQIKELIGKGGCGEVYLAQKENKNYEMKIIPFLTEDEIENYKKILNRLFNIKSEYVIKYYESFVENECLYIVMEYGGNTDLKKFIKEHKPALIEENIIKDIIINMFRIKRNT